MWSSLIILLILYLVYASYYIGSGVYVKAICKSDAPGVVLTFDDGVDEIQTPKVLDVLKKYDAKAIFFIIGEKAEKHPHLVQRIVAEGHKIGIHSYTHKPIFPILAYDNMHKEVWDTKEKKKKITGEIVDLFQFSTAIGISSIKQTKPLNLYEATSTNCLMRLMGQEGKLTPLDKFTLFKSDISNWYKEMSDYNLQEHEVSLLKEYLEMEYGVCATQESMMKILMAIGFDMKQANYARKVVAKKKFRDIDNLKKLVYDVATEKGFSINIIDYVWDNVVSDLVQYATKERKIIRSEQA